MSQPGLRNNKSVLPAIFLISAATLTYEIGLTRIFAISQGYHFSFMVISIALLGIGAGGAVVMVAGNRLPSLSSLAVLFSVVSILSFFAANQILFDPVKASWSRLEFLKILAQYMVLSLPFVISGMVLSTAYRTMNSIIHRLYFADMAGAGTGSILVLYILTKSGGEGAIIVSAILSIIASLLFLSASHIKEKSLFLPLIAKVVVLLAVLGSSPLIEINISPYRELASILNFPGARVIDTLFSPSGRMDIIDSPAVRAAPGISLTYQDPLPPQLGFTINGGGLTTVTNRHGDLSFLQHLPSSLLYHLKQGGDVFIIEPGGGMEALSALKNGAKGVWGSETKGIVISGMKGPLSTFSGNLYKELDIRHGFARDILRKSGHRFDLIQVPLTDTLGSSSSGIMGLHEDYNLTTEAFSQYLKYLKLDGFISASIYIIPPPRQELKLLATMAEAIQKSVKEKVEVEKKIIAIRSWGVLTILAKNGSITVQEIEAVKEFCNRERFDLVWYPGMREDEANLYNRLPGPVYFKAFKTILTGDREQFFRDYLFEVRPATDDRPFFGTTFKMTRVRETFESVGKKWGILIEGGYLLPWVLVQSVLASIILIMSPLLLTSSPSGGGGLRWEGINLLPITAYFSSIGIGFMFLEISLMQRMIPVLGEPIYAISAVLFTLLLSTGIGSYLSERLRITDRYSFHILLVIPLLALIYLLIMKPATDGIVMTGTLTRFLLTFVLLFPLGTVMGLPFPAGMALLGKKQPDLIPWAWCINGSFSVISSVLAMMLALAWGFSTVHILAVVCYVIAWLAVIPLVLSQSSAQTKLP